MKNLIPKELEDRLIWKEPRINAATPEPIPYVEKIRPLPCEDCGKTLDKTRYVDSRIVQNPFPTVVKVCRTCKLYAHPTTGEFELQNNELRTILSDLSRKRDK